MINCCNEPASSSLCFRVPVSYLASESYSIAATPASPIAIPAAVAAATITLPSSSYSLRPHLPGCAQPTSSASSHLLHATTLKHDPYTPDSMDSPSPNALCAIGCSTESVPPELDGQHDGPTDLGREAQQRRSPKHAAVSASLLKSKLELIAERRKSRAALGSESNSEDDNEKEEEEEDSAGARVEVADTGQWLGARTSRSNSDVSWQRSHLLTRAWLQGSERQVYRSFSEDLDRGADEARRAAAVAQQQQYPAVVGMVIPRIAIINASNFESSASSVHLEDCAKHAAGLSRGTPSDQYLGTCYSNTRTKSLSEADSSQCRSPGAFSVEEDEAQERLEEEEEEERRKDAELLQSRIEAASEPVKGSAAEESGRVESARTTTTTTTTTTASKPTTRSNSIKSQEANVSLKLKAYNKVTERCKRNIADKGGRCKKCCVVS